MKNTKLSFKHKVNRILMLASIAIVFTLCLFLLQFFVYSISTTQQKITIVSEQLISDIEESFLYLEQSSMALAFSDNVKNLLIETEPLIFHKKSELVRDELLVTYTRSELVNNILLFDMQGNFVRLKGELGNTSMDRIYYSLVEKPNERHMNLTLESEKYLAYVTNIYDDYNQIGYSVFLINSQDLADYFLNDSITQDLEVSILASGEIIASNISDYETNPNLISESSIYSLQHIGITPYEILVINDKTLEEVVLSSLIIASISLFLFVALLYFVFKVFNQQFIIPISTIIDNSEKIHNPNQKLPATGQEDFDLLIDNINLMNMRVLEQEQKLYKAERQMQMTEIERQKATVFSLKKQINAHFTVNTLNVIKCLNTTSKIDDANKICDGLAFLLRYANDVEQNIMVLEEIFVLKKYLEILLIRFPNRFTFVEDINDDCNELYIPRMLLQPIVENAINHGFVYENEYILKISTYIIDDKLKVEIKNNGMAIETKKLEQLKNDIATAHLEPLKDVNLEGIALLNIQKRIVSLFGRGYGLSITSDITETCVVITLPIEYI